MSGYKNLFKNYFNTTGISYQTTGIVCDGAANAGKDLSFSFSDSQGQITDNKNILSSIDLKDINVGLSEYGTQTKILAPNTSYLLSGNTNGPAYAAQFFNSCLSSKEYHEWYKYVNVQFNLSHLCNYRQVTTRYETYKEVGDTTSFIDVVQKLLDKQKANIQISIEKIKFQDIESEFIVFRSNQLGYEFVVTDLRLVPIYEDEDWPDSPFTTNEINFSRADWDEEENISDFFPNGEVDCEIINKIINSITNGTELEPEFVEEWQRLIYFMTDYSPDVHKMYELLPLRVHPMKYPNGAMNGIVLKVEYPDASVLPIRINHITDCITEYNPVTLTEDASLVTPCDEDNFYSDWHTPTVHDRVLFQEFKYNVRASYINPEENDVHDWLDGGIYVHDQISDQVEDDGWVSGTRMVESCSPRPSYPCDKRYVTNRKPQSDGWCNDGWMNESPMEYEDLYWADGHVDTQDFIGMYGYLNHVNKNHLWNNLGTFYAIFGQSNDENSNDNTMIPSAFLYNPNNVPVKITYMIFS